MELRSIYIDRPFFSLRPVLIMHQYPDIEMARYLLESGHYSVPVIPNIHTKVYEAASRPGALDMSSWHHPMVADCHCRAGWVVTLAGKEGKRLEDQTSTGVAATMIYLKSDPSMTRTPSYCGPDEPALADMKAMADRERELDDYIANLGNRITADPEPEDEEPEDEPEEEDEKELALA